MFLKLWKDDTGALLSAELVLAGTILVLGVVVGLQSFAQGVAYELADLGHAIGSLNQSYQVGGAKTHDGHSFSGLSSYDDGLDQCDTLDCEPCIIICTDTQDAKPGS